VRATHAGAVTGSQKSLMERAQRCGRAIRGATLGTVSTTEQVVTTERVAVGGTELYLVRGGTGPPMLVLHGMEGHEGWLAFHAALAAGGTVLAPSHPGFGHTECPPWLRTIQHQAVFYNWFLQTAGLEQVTLVGIGVGGWIAAQMAVMCQASLRHLVLVDAAGIRPEHTEILDVFVTPWKQVLDQAFADPRAAPEYARIFGGGIAEFGGSREAGRTMSMRMCFRPFMYDPALPGMLGKVQVPTLIVWGREDRIVPLECAYQYQQAIPRATVRVLDRCGHFAHFEQPRLLAETISEFVAS
jgi:pimeloyl-ACP methyl ester carboxylesterase